MRISTPYRIALLALALCVSLTILGCTPKPIPTGWQEIDGQTFYMDENGQKVTGWQEIDGNRYYFSQDHLFLTGWQEVEGARRYFSQDGILLSGWTDLPEGRYYLSDMGEPIIGWLALADGRYYIKKDGTMLTGWLEDQGRMYYFGQSGAMVTGWADLEGQRYYFSADGSMATGLVTLEDGTYYLKEDGTPHSGWIEVEGIKRYFFPDGLMAVGEQTIDGQRLHFTPKGERVILVNPWNYIPEDYSPTLVSVKGGRVSDECAESLARMLEDCKAAGLNPLICSAYRTMEDQEFLFDRKVKYYLNKDYSMEDARREAGTEVAVPGTSEHQLGLAVDIIDADNYSLDESQAAMPAQIWLMEHCWEYGFILRYPDEKSAITGIIYEPWHYRYVGVEIALELRDSGLCLEEYLGATQPE